jgi:hypothetical protein
MTKLKAYFKVIAKLETYEFILLYRSIIRESKNKKCDINGLKSLIQYYIPVNKKAEWICAIYDR